MRTKLLIAFGCLLLFPAMNSAQRRFHGRPGFVYVRPYPVYRYYDPFWDPWYHRQGYYGWTNPNQGEIQFKDFDKHADVYINGSFAGEVGKVNNMSLAPGSYDVVVKSHGEQIAEHQVYVVAGKTVKIKAGVG